MSASYRRSQTPDPFLERGRHSEGGGCCFMEWVSLLTGGPHTDRPESVSPWLARFGSALNDRADDRRRQDLKRYGHAVLGTAGDGLDEARARIAAGHVQAAAGDGGPDLRTAVWGAVRTAVLLNPADAAAVAVQAAVAAVRESVTAAAAVEHRQAAHVGGELAATACAAVMAGAVPAAAARVVVARVASATAAAAESTEPGWDRWALRGAIYTALPDALDACLEAMADESWAAALALYGRLIAAKKGTA